MATAIFAIVSSLCVVAMEDEDGESKEETHGPYINPAMYRAVEKRLHAANEKIRGAWPTCPQVLIDLVMDYFTASPPAIATGQSHSLIAIDGQLLAWGSNSHGQLGDGTTCDCRVPKEILFNDNVVQIAAGKYHSLALTSTGTLYAWGANFYGQLGIGCKGKPYLKPVRVLIDDSIVQIVAVFYGSYALTKNGQILAWGNSSIPGGGTNFLEPQRIEQKDFVVQIAAGNGGVLALAKTGKISKIMGWSHSDFMAKEVEIPGVIQIAVGDLFFLALTDAGTVWAWGSWGRVSSERPMQLELPTSMEQIVATDAYVLTLNYKSEVLGCWGGNRFGQLGNKKNLGGLELMPMSLKAQAVQISAGSSHSLVLTLNDKTGEWEVFASGLNNHGQLGDGSQKKAKTPVLVKLPKHKKALLRKLQFWR